MKRSKQFFAALAGLVAGWVALSLVPDHVLFHAHDGHAAETAPNAGGRWACPMMDYVGNAPGTCPVCGMKLTPVVSGEMNAETVKRAEIETVRVTAGAAVQRIRATGLARYDDRSARPVIPRVGGRITQRFEGALHEGRMVQAGDPLVELYSPEVYAAQGELVAASKLGQNETVASVRARFQRWNLEDVASAVLAGAEPKDTIVIRSPFSGRALAPVGDGGMKGRLPEVGEEWMADRPLVRLVQPHEFMIVVQVPEAQGNWIQEGDGATLVTDAGRELPPGAATVAWVSPELNVELRSREVHIHLREETGTIRAGTLVSVSLLSVLPAPSPDRQFALVPKTAILSTGVRNVAWKVSERKADGSLKFALAPVALGPRLEDPNGNDQWVILSGLEPGDEVVTRGAFLVDSQAQLAGTSSLLYPAGSAAPTHAEPGHHH